MSQVAARICVTRRCWASGSFERDRPSILLTPMTFFRGRLVCNLQTAKILLRHRNILPNLVVQFRLIPLQRQHVIPTAFFNLLRYRSLASHRIQRHDTPLQFQLLQQLRHRRNLVRLLLRVHLPKHYSIAASPSTDHMQRLHPSLAIMRTPMGLAVQRDDLAVAELDHIFHPTRVDHHSGQNLQPSPCAYMGSIAEKGEMTPQAPEHL